MRAKLTPPSKGHVGAKAKPKSSKKKIDPKVKAAADRAERRAKGEAIEPEYGVLNPPERAEAKRPPWRPSKYNPDFCELVVDLGRQGKSKEVMAVRCGVIPETLENWAKTYPDFFEALTYAQACEQEWWEEAGQTLMALPNFSAAAWSRSMSARFPKKWREQKQVDHGLSSDLNALLTQIDGHGASLI
jgi:hypothetical protein